MVVTEEHNALLVIFMLYQSHTIHHVPAAAVSTERRSAGSFPEQRLVIERILRIDTWSCLF